MKNLIDLHIHTTMSDGSQTPKDILKLGVNSGLKAISITDHDNIDGIIEIQKKKMGFDIELIPGIELSVGNSPEMHVLGYFIDIDNMELREELRKIKKKRIAESLLLIRQLKRSDLDIDIRVLTESGYSIDGFGITMMLIKKGIVKDKNEAIQKYFSKGKPLFVKKYNMTFERAIDLIKGAGGIAILAHPTTVEDDLHLLEKKITELKMKGLDGIECYNSKFKENPNKSLIKIAKRNDLIITGGSDYHGLVKPGVKIGCGFGDINVKYDILEKIKEYKDNK